MSFADRSPSPEAASNWGFFQIALLTCNLAFNLSIFVYTLGKLLWAKALTFFNRLKVIISSSSSISRKSHTVKILASPAPQQQQHQPAVDLTHNLTNNISSLDILLPADHSLAKTTLPPAKPNF